MSPPCYRPLRKLRQWKGGGQCLRERARCTAHTKLSLLPAPGTQGRWALDTAMHTPRPNPLSALQIHADHQVRVRTDDGQLAKKRMQGAQHRQTSRQLSVMISRARLGCAPRCLDARCCVLTRQDWANHLAAARVFYDEGARIHAFAEATLPDRRASQPVSAGTPPRLTHPTSTITSPVVIPSLPSSLPY